MTAGLVPEQLFRIYILNHRQQKKLLGLTGTKPAPSSNKATAPDPFQIRIDHANVRAHGAIFILATTGSLQTSTATKELCGTPKAHRVNENPLYTRMIFIFISMVLYTLGMSQSRRQLRLCFRVYKGLGGNTRKSYMGNLSLTPGPT